MSDKPENTSSIETQSYQHQPESEHIELILPTTGKVFYEHKDELRFCQPHLMPLKSFSLHKLEKMQVEAHKRMQEVRSQQQSN